MSATPRLSARDTGPRGDETTREFHESTRPISIGRCPSETFAQGDALDALLSTSTPNSNLRRTASARLRSAKLATEGSPSPLTSAISGLAEAENLNVESGSKLRSTLSRPKTAESNVFFASETTTMNGLRGEQKTQQVENFRSLRESGHCKEASEDRIDVDDLLQDLTDILPGKKPGTPARSAAGRLSTQLAPSALQSSSSPNHDASSSVSLKLSTSTPLPLSSVQSPRTAVGRPPAATANTAGLLSSSSSQSLLANVSVGMKSPLGSRQSHAEDPPVSPRKNSCPSSPVPPRADEKNSNTSATSTLQQMPSTSREGGRTEDTATANGFNDEDLALLLPEGRKSHSFEATTQSRNTERTRGNRSTATAGLLTGSLVEAAQKSSRKSADSKESFDAPHHQLFTPLAQGQVSGPKEPKRSSTGRSSPQEISRDSSSQFASSRGIPSPQLAPVGAGKEDNRTLDTQSGRGGRTCRSGSSSCSVRRQASRANSMQQVSLLSALTDGDSELDAILSLGLPQPQSSSSLGVSPRDLKKSPSPPAATSARSRNSLSSSVSGNFGSASRQPASPRPLLGAMGSKSSLCCEPKDADCGEVSLRKDARKQPKSGETPLARNNLEEGEVVVRSSASVFQTLSRSSIPRQQKERHALSTSSHPSVALSATTGSGHRARSANVCAKASPVPLSREEERRTEGSDRLDDLKQSVSNANSDTGEISSVAAAAAAEAARGAAAAEAAAAAAADAAAAVVDRETSKDLQIEHLRAENRKLHLEKQLLQQRLQSELRASEATSKRSLAAERAQWEGEKNRLEIQNRSLQDEVSRLESHRESESRRFATALHTLEEEQENERKRIEKQMTSLLEEEEKKKRREVEKAVEDGEKKREIAVKEIEKKMKREMEALKKSHEEDLARVRQQATSQRDICTLLRHVESSAESIKLISERLAQESTHGKQELDFQRAEREATMKAMEDELKTQQRQTAEQHGALVALLADFQRQQKESEDRNRKERERLDADHAALRQLQLTLKGAEEQQRRAFEELRTAVDDEKRDLMRKTQAKEFELKEREHRLEIAQRRLESQQRAVDAATRGVEETRARAAARLREVEGEVFTERKLALRDLEAAEQERRQLQQTKQEISLLQEDLDRRRQVVEEEGQKNLTRLVQVQRKEAEIKRLHAEAVEARAQAELRAMQAEQESSKCEERLQHVQALSKFVQKEQLDLLRLENRFLDPQTSLVSLSSSSLPSRASGVSRALRASQPLDLTHDCRQTNMFFRGRSYSFSSSFPPSLLLPSAQSSRLSASLPLNSGAASRPWREEREAAREGAFWSLPQGVRERVSGVSAHPVTSSAYRRSPSAASSSESTILPPFLLQAFLRTPSRLSIRTSAVSTAQPPTSRGSSFLEGATDSCPSGLLSCVSSVSPFFESRANSAGHFALQRVSHKGSGESDLHNSSATRFWTRRRSHCQGEERKANASSGSSLALRRPSSSFASRGGGADHREERRGYEQALLARIDLATAGEFRPPRRRHSFREREQGVREREEDLTRGERGEGVKVEIRERRTDAGTAQSNLRPGSAGRVDGERRLRERKEDREESGERGEADERESARSIRRTVFSSDRMDEKPPRRFFDSPRFEKLVDAAETLAARRQDLSERIEFHRSYTRNLESLYQQQWLQTPNGENHGLATPSSTLQPFPHAPGLETDRRLEPENSAPSSCSSSLKSLSSVPLLS